MEILEKSELSVFNTLRPHLAQAHRCWGFSLQINTSFVQAVRFWMYIAAGSRTESPILRLTACLVDKFLQQIKLAFGDAAGLLCRLTEALLFLSGRSVRNLST